MKPGAQRRGAGKKKWTKTVSNDLASEASRIAKLIADRMLEGERLAENIAGLSSQTESSQMSVYWDGYGLMQGFAGLAAMYNQLDHCFPKEGWQRPGSHFLKISSSLYYDAKGSVDCSLCSGVAGLGYVAIQSPRGKAAYKVLTSNIGTVLEQELARKVEEINKSDGLSQNQFDALYGITGIGRYLLACETSKQPSKLLVSLLRTLVARSEMSGTIPRIFTPPELLHPAEQLEFRGATVNCGLAHGVPGPLALMSLAVQAGTEVEGLLEAVQFWSEWLTEQIIEDEWGANWPGVIVAGTPEKPVATRAGWCYGVPGVSRALYLAGEALEDSKLKKLAVRAMLSVYRRPIEVQRNQAPTLCHGRSGLLQITLRFAADTGLSEFQKHSEDLCRGIVESFDKEKIWGYQDSLADGARIDNPGLLCGAGGIVLSLLSAACAVEPIWDQTFMLS